MDTVEVQNEVFLPHVVALVNEGHSVTITARGNSMMPFIHDGRDSLIFSRIEDRVRVGDAVLAELSKGVFVCHRIVDINGEKVTLRGDGNIRGTETCTVDGVKALLVGVVRNGKTVNLKNSKAWHVYSMVWPRLLPIRRYLLALYRLVVMHKLPQRWSRK